MATVTMHECAQEAAYWILSLPMRYLSRAEQFVNVNSSKTRIGVLRKQEELKQFNDNDTNVFQKSLIDRYKRRPMFSRFCSFIQLVIMILIMLMILFHVQQQQIHKLNNR